MLAATAHLACQPVTESPLGDASQRIVGGTEAPEDAATVALLARRTRCGGEGPVLLCTGALIAPDVVLTAAHCFALFGPEGQHEVFIGQRLLPEPEPQGRFIRVRRAVLHPAYEPETHAHDVALLRLAKPVDVTPFPLPDGTKESLVAGATARVLGYGDTKDASEAPGQRRQGTLAVTQVEPAAFRASPAPSMSCVGDSGGPVLVSDGTREVLAGITVSGDVACREEALNVRVDALLDDFIRPFLAETPAEDAPILSLDSLCRETCTRDSDCPSGLTCVTTGSEPGRCLLPALQEGAFGDLCRDDAACGAGGTCARLESEGADACRCFTPCTVTPDPTPPGGAPEGGEGGCTGAPGPFLPALLLAASWLGARGRRRVSGPGVVARAVAPGTREG